MLCIVRRIEGIRYSKSSYIVVKLEHCWVKSVDLQCLRVIWPGGSKFGERFDVTSSARILETTGVHRDQSWVYTNESVIFINLSIMIFWTTENF